MAVQQASEDNEDNEDIPYSTTTCKKFDIALPRKWREETSTPLLKVLFLQENVDVKSPDHPILYTIRVLV